MKKQQRHGFTLVEVLIVVVILGILAATVLPQFTAASSDAKESALVQDLQQFRSQIQLYKFQHEGKFPGTATETDFKKCLLQQSDVKGLTGAGKPFGPYFVGQLPPNPYNGGRGVKIVADIAAAVPNEADMDGTDKVGWIYSPTEGRIKGNNTDKAANGQNLSDL